MAGGKLSPRQKMINMMYLVLTALLAMNVSSEILNAFKTVNNSIITSNKQITDQNNTVYKTLDEAKQDPQTAAKAAVWEPRAKDIKAKSAAIYDEIEALKKEIKTASGLEMVDGEEKFKEDDLDAATRILIEQKKGDALYNKITKFKTELLGVIKPSEVSDNPVVQKQIAGDMENFAKTLPVKMDIPKSKTGTKYTQDGKGWSEANFHMTPTIAAVTILSKLQNDVKNSEAKLSDYCLQQLGKVKVIYDEFAAIASASTNYCMPGEPIEVYAGVGAFSDAAKPSVVIGGAAQQLVDGMATYKTTAKGAGNNVIPVKISFTKPDGTIATVNKDIKYTVGIPSGAAVALDKMNVFYIGVPNPVTVSSGVGDEKTSITLSQGSASKKGPGKYDITVPGPPGEIKLTVNADKVTNPFTFRVKRIPNPVATLGATLEGGKVNKGTLIAQSGLVALLKDFDFDARFTVESFDLVYISKGEIFPKSGVGPLLTPEMKGYILRAAPRDVYTFENIKVKGPDGQSRKIPGITFLII
ncbi:MAG: gliding motility protein GldM [Chitinophagales bacterium]|nr:gliding motility protein GldM [Chitinophagales bacterium]